MSYSIYKTLIFEEKALILGSALLWFDLGKLFRIKLMLIKGSCEFIV